CNEMNIKEILPLVSRVKLIALRIVEAEKDVVLAWNHRALELLEPPGERRRGDEILRAKTCGKLRKHFTPRSRQRINLQLAIKSDGIRKEVGNDDLPACGRIVRVVGERRRAQFKRPMWCLVVFVVVSPWMANLTQGNPVAPLLNLDNPVIMQVSQDRYT